MHTQSDSFRTHLKTQVLTLTHACAQSLAVTLQEQHRVVQHQLRATTGSSSGPSSSSGPNSTTKLHHAVTIQMFTTIATFDQVYRLLCKFLATLSNDHEGLQHLYALTLNGLLSCIVLKLEMVTAVEATAECPAVGEPKPDIAALARLYETYRQQNHVRSLFPNLILHYIGLSQRYKTMVMYADDLIRTIKPILVVTPHNVIQSLYSSVDWKGQEAFDNLAELVPSMKRKGGSKRR
eukprot:TRINITY_DN71557_c0_g1_i1.p1 TRINITY_DN71557_c0_g1~~TRINITY_DN71557_c0_g1_i1.p1  ORF type:complete len:261 (-),score=22.38 TRINITY_DN71557_c0_g1_i1:153-860(-)